MAEIDSLGTNYYYAGVQNASNNGVKRNNKADESSRVKKSRFSDLLKTESKVESEFTTQGLPPEIASMSIDEAAVFLKDAVDLAGNELSEEVTQENVEKFKTAVKQFITFVVNNNYVVTAKRSRRPQFVSPVNYFSNYNTKPRLKDPKIQVEVINKKLEALANETLSLQMNNFQILAKANEIKGLIVDLMSS